MRLLSDQYLLVTELWQSASLVHARRRKIKVACCLPTGQACSATERHTSSSIPLHIRAAMAKLHVLWLPPFGGYVPPTRHCYYKAITLSKKQIAINDLAKGEKQL